MVVKFYALNDNSRLLHAKSLVVDCIIEFIGDESANAKLLCEISSTSSCEPIMIRQPTVVQQLLPGLSIKVLWAQSLDLPYHEEHQQYHGKFLCDRYRFAMMVRDMCYELKVFGGNFGSTLHHPVCQPYVLVYGRKKADVIKATKEVKSVMQNHQQTCNCGPLWET